MNAFDPTPPEWIQLAIHALHFSCPRCEASSRQSTHVWLNRRTPVYTEQNRRKWQEFYHCDCGQVWWAWSDERPPSLLKPRDPLL
jgi:hypothetical protein